MNKAKGNSTSWAIVDKRKRRNKWGGLSDTHLDALLTFGGLFHEPEEDVVRRIIDRIHRGHPMRAVRL